MKAAIRLAIDCCALCNPGALADFEPLCVVFSTLAGDIALCGACVGKMGSALDSREPVSWELHPEAAMAAQVLRLAMTYSEGEPS